MSGPQWAGHPRCVLVGPFLICIAVWWDPVPACTSGWHLPSPVSRAGLVPELSSAQGPTHTRGTQRNFKQGLLLRPQTCSWGLRRLKTWPGKRVSFPRALLLKTIPPRQEPAVFLDSLWPWSSRTTPHPVWEAWEVGF